MYIIGEINSDVPHQIGSIFFISVLDVWFAIIASTHIHNPISFEWWFRLTADTKYSRIGRVSALPHRFIMEGLLSV
jgi:hypothetical protein